MNLFKSTLDTRHPNGVIATITRFDNATLELQILSDGQIGDAWESPKFELIAMKRDGNSVREVDQDKFTILSKEDHKVQIELKEQFLTCRGTVKMQLVIKEGNRLSTTLFYLSIGQSLDHDIVDSHRDVAVLDELEAYIKQGFDDLAYQEQRMEVVEQSTNDLNDTMNANEAKRNKAEAIRQEVFDTNEAHRTRTFNSQVEEQRTAFNNVQTQRDESFNQSQQNMTQEFEASQRAREGEFDASQKTNQNTFSDNESKRQTTFAQSQSANQQEFDQMMEESRQTFDAAELKRQQLFDANEQARGQNESRRVQNESQRAQAETQRAATEVIRQQKMAQFEEKATQLSKDLDIQVARVDEFVTSNEAKLLGPNDKKDYMGNSHESVKEAMDANVDWLLGEINTVHYDGQHITATDSIEGRSKSAILKGNTLVNIFDVALPTEIKNNHDITLSYQVNANETYTFIIEAESTSEKYQGGFITTNGGANGWNGSVDNGISKFTVTTSEATNKVRFSALGASNTVQIKKCMIIKGDYSNQDIPFFTGMQSVKMPVLTTTGKNLFNIDDFTQKTGIPNNNGEIIFDESTIGKKYYFDVSEFPLYFSSELVNASTVGAVGIKFCYKDGSSEVCVFNTQTNSEKALIKELDYLEVCRWGTNFTVKNIQLETGVQKTSYEPYKSNILTTPEDVVLRKVGDVEDTLDLVSGEYVQRIGEIVLDGSEAVSVYSQNDETYTSFTVGPIFTENYQVSTKFLSVTPFTFKAYGNTYLYIRDIPHSLIGTNKDSTNAERVSSFKNFLENDPIKIFYTLNKESIKTVDLSDNHVYSYKDVTHYDCSSAEGSLVPTLSIDVPTNLPAVVARQRVTIQELEKENVALKNEIEETANSSVNGDLELMSSQFELDFRIFEIEMNLDMPMMAMMRGVKSMAMTVYQQAKTLILAGKYERENMEYKLNRYKEAGRITVEEYEELIALMDARELVD